MGNSQVSGAPVDTSRESQEEQSALTSADDFERRWKVFLQSLDISSGHLKHVESLDKQKKIELLLSFESKNPLCNVAKSINLLRNLDWNQILGNNKKKDSGITLRSLLSSTEISLRTNSVDWVYEFLQCDGLEVLSDFMTTCLQLLSRNVGGQSCHSPGIRRSKQGYQNPAPSLPSLNYAVCIPSENGDSQPCLDLVRSISVTSGNPVNCGSRQPIPDTIKDLLKDCLHLSLRCLKTILNNQSGCKRAFEYPQVIRVITFCLLHPSFMTKALALDLLTALCLIEGGHSKVLQAFDKLRQVMGEGLRFEMLLDSFKQHETLDVEQYNIDFAVACVQFFNIVVHSPENINLRVYLQYELYLLGLDDVLKNLKDRAGDRLVQHIEAYLDNRVDCSLLLEDAEAKESAVSDLERFEAEVASKISSAKETSRVEAEAAFKARELELSELVESLRSRIRDLNVASWDRENAMKHRVDELQQALQASRSEVTKLRTALDTLKSRVASSEKMCASMATSTHFELDVNGKDPESGRSNRIPCPGPKESGRSTSIDTDCDPQLIQPAQSVDRSMRVRRDPLETATSVASTKSDTAERKTGSYKIWNNGPQKPIRKQATLDLVDKPPEQPNYQNDTVIRRLAAEAATTLSQLVNNNNPSINGANVTNGRTPPVLPYFIVPPSTWPYSSIDNPVPSNTLFSTETLLKSLSLHSISINSSTENASQLDRIWNQYWVRWSEPWLSAAQQSNALFSTTTADTTLSSDCTGSSQSFEWLVDLGFLPTNVDELSSTAGQSSQVDSLVRHWKLYRSLTQFTLPCLPAQRLLWQIRTEALSHHTPSSGFQSCLLDQIEIALTQRFGSVRRADWRFHATAENRWFWTSALLRINLLWQLFPAELQRIAEGLSSLLAGCTSILVNSKLPIVLQLAILFAQRTVANWTTDTFDLRYLDALIDWNLSGLALPTTNLHPPVNGGPPAYQAHSASVNESQSGSDRKSTNRGSCSFMAAFVRLISQLDPNLMDWPAELTHIEPAMRVSIDDILMRIQDMETAVQVWQVISPLCPTESGFDKTECPTLSEIQLVLQDVNQQVIRLRQAAESTRAVVQSTAHWLRTSSSITQSFQTDRLAPLIRFATAFKWCVTDMEKKRRNAATSAESTHGSTPSHRHEHRRAKNDKDRRRKHRTRLLDSDGIMDDILAGLTYQPLRTDIHTKRKDSVGQKPSN